MARINVDDDYWTDPRRETLGLYIGDQEKADGRMLRAWRISQSYYRQGEYVPEKLWESSKLDGILECGLAERRNGGIYCKGSDSHFDWISPKAKAGHIGGIASAKARKERDGTAIPVNARNRSLFDDESSRSTTEAEPNAASVAAEADRSTTEPSYILTSSQLETSSLVESRPTPLDLARLWNELRDPSQPEVRLSLLKPGSPRWKAADARLRDEPDLKTWRSVIETIANSAWCTGDNDRGWTADFGFLVKPETHIKVAEGKYANRKGTAKAKKKEITVISEVTSLDELY